MTDTAKGPVRSKSSGTERPGAPFRYSGPPHVQSSYDKRESFYCHGYRREGEHYHGTFGELLQCPAFPDDPRVPYKPKVRK